MNKNYVYTISEDYYYNEKFHLIDNFNEYINILKYYILYFEERIKYQRYMSKEEIFNDDDSYCLFTDVEDFYNRMMNELTIFDNHQEYIIHEDEESVALSYVGDNDNYELQEKRWMIMLDNCKIVYFIIPGYEFDEDDEYNVYYDITIYEMVEKKYIIKKMKLEELEDLGLPELNLVFDNPKTWINNEILNRAYQLKR